MLHNVSSKAKHEGNLDRPLPLMDVRAGDVVYFKHNKTYIYVSEGRMVLFEDGSFSGNWKEFPIDFNLASNLFKNVAKPFQLHFVAIVRGEVTVSHKFVLPKGWDDPYGPPEDKVEPLSFLYFSRMIKAGLITPLFASIILVICIFVELNAARHYFHDDHYILAAISAFLSYMIYCLFPHVMKNIRTLHQNVCEQEKT